MSEVLKSRCHQSRLPSAGAKGESIPWPFPASRGACIPWLMAPPPSSKPAAQHRHLSLSLTSATLQVPSSAEARAENATFRNEEGI